MTNEPIGDAPFPTYADLPSWLRYRALLAERFDLTIETEPEELSIDVRGHRLHVDRWTAAAGQGDPAKGTVVLVHGAGGHGRILAPLGDFITTLGWDALAPDLPGYGLSRPASDFDWDYAEWPAVVAELARGCTGPVVLLGMSVGGPTAVHASLQEPQVAGVIATTLLDMSDAASFRAAARWRWLAAASLLGFGVIPGVVDRISLPLRWAAPMRAMTTDAALGRFFASDPLLGGLRIPAKLYRTMHQHRQTSLRMHCPLLVVHPGTDSWTPTNLSRPTFDRVEGRKRFRELTNGSHLPAEQPARQELMGEVATFLREIESASTVRSRRQTEHSRSTQSGAPLGSISAPQS